MLRAFRVTRLVHEQGHTLSGFVGADSAAAGRGVGVLGQTVAASAVGPASALGQGLAANVSVLLLAAVDPDFAWSQALNLGPY